MKTRFDIGGEVEGKSEHTLLLEVGKDYGSAAFLNKSKVAIERIQLNAFDEFDLENEVAAFVDSLSPGSIGSAVICSAFPQALLFPQSYFRNDYSTLDLLYDQQAHEYFNDPIPDWQMVNAYSLPASVNGVLQKAFPSSRYFHAFTPAIKIYNGYVADNQLSVHFLEQSFRVLLKKDMHIHLAQTYNYRTPLDVVYYLLKICYEFNLSQQKTYLILSGPVEKNSALFTELQQYFINIHFAQQPEISLPQTDHPHYYFTSLYNLAACVL